MKALEKILKKLATGDYLSGSCDTDDAIQQADIDIHKLVPLKIKYGEDLGLGAQQNVLCINGINNKITQTHANFSKEVK